MERDNLTWCQYIGTVVYPGGSRAWIIKYEDGTTSFVPLVTYK